MPPKPTVDELKSRAGLLLYRELPEEYRYRDLGENGEMGDLEAYLHGFGHLLDLVRRTTEQAYADAFAEEVHIFDEQPGDKGTKIQTWLVPYLAELVGAELMAPDPERRADELNNSVGWFKSKGTLLNIDSVADTVSGIETVPVEGWRLVLTTPSPSLPPFTSNRQFPDDGSVAPPQPSPMLLAPYCPACGPASLDPDPLGTPVHPLGTPDLSKCNRAVVDPHGTSPLHRIVTPQRDADGVLTDPRITYWRPLARYGVPCFPNGFDDVSARTPDLRDPRYGPIGPNPKRTLIYLRPPYGLFEPDLKKLTLPAPGPGVDPLDFLSQPPHAPTYTPAEVLEALVNPVPPIPDKIVLKGDLVIPSGHIIEFEDVLFLDKIRVEKGAQLVLRRCAVREVKLPVIGPEPSLDAKDSLFETLTGAPGYARLELCTVLKSTNVERLQASDCIFAGPIVGMKCDDDQSCVRFSSITSTAALSGCCFEKSRSNTTDPPVFARFYFDKPCVLRAAVFGEPGSGVLDLTTPDSVQRGAEDGGEMGAGNHLYLCARARALTRKLQDFLPFGQETAVRYDPMLARPLAKLKT